MGAMFRKHLCNLGGRLRGSLCACLFLVALACAAQPRLDILDVPGRTLRDNPLHDPVERKAAILLPAQYATNSHLRVVYFLPGYGGSPDSYIRQPDKWLKLVQAEADRGLPMVLVVVDGRTRWGGSQYLNSPAQGNYADYVVDEIVPLIEKRYRLAVTRGNRVIAGHSSGGFGALRLASMRPRLFGAVVALSPDSDFEVSHRPLMTVPAVSEFGVSQVMKVMGPAPTAPVPADGGLKYALGLSAAYAPLGKNHPGEFDWLYDGNGRFREDVWRRWMENDPLTIVRKSSRAFRPYQSVYLDGAAEDEYKANIGARKIYEILRHRPGRCAFEEPPGKHSSRAAERLQRGLEWVFAARVN